MPERVFTGEDLPAAAVEQILLLLSPVDRAAASATCRAWRAIEVSSRLLYGDVTLDGASLTPSEAERSASSVGSWLAARLGVIQHFKLWTPYPLDSLASGVVDLLASANKLMVSGVIGPFRRWLLGLQGERACAAAKSAGLLQRLVSNERPHSSW